MQYYVHWFPTSVITLFSEVDDVQGTVSEMNMGEDHNELLMSFTVKVHCYSTHSFLVDEWDTLLDLICMEKNLLGILIHDTIIYSAWKALL